MSARVRLAFGTCEGHFHEGICRARRPAAPVGRRSLSVMLGGLNLLVYEIFPIDLVFRNYARAANVLRTKL